VSQTTPGSWQPDPYRRFAQRYWDGANWTEHVTDASGARYTDPPVASAAATYAPPAATYAPPSSSGSALPVPGLVVAGIGALLLLLSDFALTWFSVGIDIKLSDLRDAASASSDVSFVVDQYLSWGYLLGLAAVALAVVALFVPSLRVAGLAAAAVMAVWHAWVVYDTGTDSFSPEIGAWLGAVGLAMAAIALLLPRPKAAA
jgi:hypothetical protein